MRIQWNLLLALIFALIVAIFAVVNVEPVLVKYVFGEAELPLILVILGSALAGGIIVGSVGLFRIFMLGRQLKASQKENSKYKSKIDELEEKLTTDNLPEQEKTNEELVINKEMEQEDPETSKEN